MQPKGIDFERQFDVIVCGAGVAGTAAALEAARAGLKTALLEKTITPGGLGTSGLVWAYPPLCDGSGRQVTHGISEELFHLTSRYGPARVSDDWREVHEVEAATRCWVTFSPAAFVLALDEALVDASVGVWLDTLVCQPIMESDRVMGVEVETKGGRGALFAQCIVDATGDADVAYRAGAPCEVGGNLLAIWAIQASLDAARKAVQQESGTPLQDLVLFGSNVADVHGRSAKAWSGLDAGSVTAFVLAGRAFLREHYARRQAAGEGAERRNAYPVTLPSMPQFRTTRRIVGRANLTGGEHGQRQPDSVGLVADWRDPDSVWEIPYGVLLPTKVRGLLAAGRCIASGGDAWEVTRLMHAAALTGQAAGIAATLAVQGGTTPDLVAPRAVQKELEEKGIPYHVDEVR